MKHLTTLFCAAVLVSACAMQDQPQKTPTPEQQAEIDAARAEMVEAECALYAEAQKMGSDVKLPEMCE